MSEKEFKIWVKAPPQDGRANEAVMQLLADYLAVPKSRLQMIQGLRGKRKVVSLKK